MNIESRASRRPRQPTAALLAEQPAKLCWSPAREHALGLRLVTCRHELLAIALLDPRAGDVLERMAADLERRKLRIGAVVELQGGPPHAARERFDAFRSGLAGLHAAGEAPAELDAAFESRLALVRAASPAWDGIEQVLQHTCVLAPRGSRRALPPSWRMRVRARLEELDDIVRQLVAAHQGLVVTVARRYRGLGLSREDLAQEGNIGLLRAIEKFDPSRGAPFGAYASWWVRQSVRRALANQARTIRLPTTAIAARYTLGRASSRLAHELGREPSEHELARATGVPPESVADLLCHAREPVSLDAPRGEDSSLTVGDRVTDPDARSPNDDVIAKDSAARLRELLGVLSPREQLVLGRRFGLGGEDEQTLEEIGRSLDLTRERVRQIVAEALDRLQRKTRYAQIEL